MIYPKGTPVIATDPDLQDVYMAILQEDWREGQARHPACLIQAMIRYPIQHAIAWPDIPNDNRPLDGGKVYRLRVLSIRADETIPTDYNSSVSGARQTALRHARQYGQKAKVKILLQHEDGVFTRPRRSAFIVKQ